MTGCKYIKFQPSTITYFTYFIRRICIYLHIIEITRDYYVEKTGTKLSVL